MWVVDLEAHHEPMPDQGCLVDHQGCIV
jgi:hypothetical protein